MSTREDDVPIGPVVLFGRLIVVSHTIYVVSHTIYIIRGL